MLELLMWVLSRGRGREGEDVILSAADEKGEANTEVKEVNVSRHGKQEYGRHEGRLMN